MSAESSSNPQEWSSPSFRPEHIENLISGVDRYNPQNLEVLHEYLAQQLDTGNYDCLANLAILKLYQFNPADFNYAVAISILLKALTAAPMPDFNLCLALLGEAPVATVPPPAPTAEGEEPAPVAASTTPSAGNLADPLIVRISQLSTLLFQARFRTFWSTLASPEYEDVRGFTTNVTGFEDAVRRSALGSVRGAFRTIGEARIASYLNLSGSELASFISQQPGWKLENGTVHVPSNPDNEIKATVIREDLQLDQLTKFLAQAAPPTMRA